MSNNGKALVIKGADFSAVAVAFIGGDTATITLNVNNNIYGSVSGGGTYRVGTTVTISATANTGYSFVSWSDGNTNASRTITVGVDATYTATFVRSSWALGVYGKSWMPPSSYLQAKYYALADQAAANIAGTDISKICTRFSSRASGHIGEDYTTPVTVEFGYYDPSDYVTHQLWSGEVTSGQPTTLNTPVQIPLGKGVYFKATYQTSVCTHVRQDSAASPIQTVKGYIQDGALTEFASDIWIDFM